MDRYILAADRSGRAYIATDKMSGGYPYVVDSHWEARIFESREDAARYTAVFSHGGAVGNWPWIPAKVDLIMTESELFSPVELGQTSDGRKGRCCTCTCDT